jgi:hypothetical protein
MSSLSPLNQLCPLIKNHCSTSGLEGELCHYVASTLCPSLVPEIDKLCRNAVASGTTSLKGLPICEDMFHGLSALAHIVHVPEATINKLQPEWNTACNKVLSDAESHIPDPQKLCNGLETALVNLVKGPA